MNEYEKLFRSTVRYFYMNMFLRFILPCDGHRRDALYNSLSTVNELTVVITTHCVALNCRVLVIKMVPAALKRPHVSNMTHSFSHTNDTCRILPNFPIQNYLCVFKKHRVQLLSFVMKQSTQHQYFLWLIREF